MAMKKDFMFFRKHFIHLLPFLVIAVLCTLLLAAWHIIERSVAEEEDTRLHAFILRAQSLGWAVEGASRAHRANLAELLEEIGRQPGVAYIALVSENGGIIADSNPAMAGQCLYTPEEMRSLSPAGYIQGRFSPDDANIFETWRQFNPGRLQGHHQIKPAVLFIALNAANFAEDMEAYRSRLITETALFVLLLLLACALFYFAINYQLSRRRLDESRALAEQIIQSYPSPLLVATLDGQISFRNKTAEDFLNMGSSAAIGQLPGLDWSGIERDLKQNITVFEQELQFNEPDGKTIPVSLSDAIVRDKEQKPMGWLIVLRDLSQIKDLERQLAESRRLAALGHMAAGIAHEIRNPLSSIRGYAVYLRQRLADNAWASATASLIEEEAIRLDRALSDLLLLSKTPKLKCEMTSLNALLGKLEALLKPDTGTKNIYLQMNLPHNDICLLLDKDRMLQALLNIALNAVEATPEGGQLTIASHKDQRNAAAWIISISDNGRGIAPGALEQIFNPYFTTRAEGTGLGLTLARQIIEAHGGNISVNSTLGKGTVFIICLPEENPCRAVQ